MKNNPAANFVIELKPGADSVVAMNALYDAKPDGYTIGVGQGGNLVTLPHTKRNLPYNPLKDFSPITISTFNYLVITANNKTPFNTVAQLIDWAKKNPGMLTVGTNGDGGFPHLTFEHFAQNANIKFSHIPYKGAAPVQNDLIGGQIMVSIGSVASQIMQVKNGNIKMIGITNEKRVPMNPNFEAIAETLPGWYSNGWHGYIAPAKTPAFIVAKLNDAINFALKAPGITDKLNQMGLIVVTEQPQFAIDLINKEYAKYGKLVKDINFQPQ
jgi:tripartite-type tricarboxylate transporter receptor subunit TctC